LGSSYAVEKKKFGGVESKKAVQFRALQTVGRGKRVKDTSKEAKRTFGVKGKGGVRKNDAVEIGGWGRGPWQKPRPTMTLKEGKTYPRITSQQERR